MLRLFRGHPLKKSRHQPCADLVFGNFAVRETGNEKVDFFRG